MSGDSLAAIAKAIRSLPKATQCPPIADRIEAMQAEASSLDWPLILALDAYLQATEGETANLCFLADNLTAEGMPSRGDSVRSANAFIDKQKHLINVLAGALAKFAPRPSA